MMTLNPLSYKYIFTQLGQPLSWNFIERVRYLRKVLINIKRKKERKKEKEIKKIIKQNKK